jgi:hypothetical protein
MKNETWEMSTLDWSKEGAHGLFVGAADVGRLIFANNKEEARNAFFILSEPV